MEVYTGGMFASKSTNLQRQGKRHTLAGREVLYIKPEIDTRYGDGVSTHDGDTKDAIAVNPKEDFSSHLAVLAADVVCIDEVQFFSPLTFISAVKTMLAAGKKVYCAGLDMDKHGVPFYTTIHLMGIADHVEKFHAVCSFCGEDAWVTVETKPQAERVTIGNDYKPACRTCAAEHLPGGAKPGRT
ncbi:thymidine kinase [Bacillus wiedmannii]|uniref:thymidine kinase n=1 Tax=Bacillus wiedmannii TaxID=1890302 RepID=UPI001143EE10|nr:hypothetical protein [Bacillus wiedmannii]